MLNWTDFTEKVYEAFARLLSLESGLHWLPLTGAAAIVFLVYILRRDRAEPTSLRGFVAFCFPARVYSPASSRLDFKYVVVNTIIYGIFIGPMVFTSTGAAQATLNLLVKTFGIP